MNERTQKTKLKREWKGTGVYSLYKKLSQNLFPKLHITDALAIVYYMYMCMMKTMTMYLATYM